MENDPSVTRIAVIKAYINRLSETKQKITIMLNPSETNIGYVAGRLLRCLTAYNIALTA